MRLPLTRPRRPAPAPPANAHRVVIVGAGFGGLAAARALARAPVHVTVVDRGNHHLFQPLLYQMATGILSSGDIAPPIRDILRRQPNARVVLGTVTDIDPAARTLSVAGDAGATPATIPYDSLIVAAGAHTGYFGHPEYADHAPGLKTIDDALDLRSRILGAFERAERSDDPEERRRLLTFVVIGGGATGVEMAGQLAELAHRTLPGEFRTIDPRAARVVLLDGAPTVLPPFPEGLRRRVRRDLDALGVETHLGVMVSGVDAEGIDTDAADPAVARIEAAVKVWAAGVEASPLGRLLAERTSAAADRGGRLQVAPDCTVPGRPEIFVVGDLMALDGLPGVAQVAIQSGRHAAHTIARRLTGDGSVIPFRYHDQGSMATVARFRAVAAIGPLRITGTLGWLLWLYVHIAALTGYANRLKVILNWTIAFQGRSRPQRAIPHNLTKGPGGEPPAGR
ncbi:MAG: NAD(P)/FAD-dependent oxidoreductase [Miltoncostaeaceae bacterium]